MSELFTQTFVVLFFLAYTALLVALVQDAFTRLMGMGLRRINAYFLIYLRRPEVRRSILDPGKQD